MSVFKLIVSSSNNSKTLLIYVKNNIKSLNRAGITVRIDKLNDDEIDDDLLDRLRQKGITSLPAMLTPDNKLFIGVNAIKKLFDSRLTPARADKIHMDDAATDDFTAGDTGDVSSYLTNAVCHGIKRDNTGRIYFDDDDDEYSKTKQEIQARLNQYQRNTPKHRRQMGDRDRRSGTCNDDEDIDAPPPRRTGPRRQNRNNYYYDDEDPEDNIADDQGDYNDAPRMPPRRRPRGRRDNTDDYGSDRRRRDKPYQPLTAAMSQDELEQRMIEAYMDNNEETMDDVTME